MASELFVDNITGKTGTSGGAPITLSGDTATLSGTGVTFPTGHIIKTYSQTFRGTDSNSTNNYVIVGDGDADELEITTDTPKSSSSKFLLMVAIGAASDGNSASIAFRLTRGGSFITESGSDSTSSNRTASTFRMEGGGANHPMGGAAFSFLDSPNSSTALTYAVTFRNQSGIACYINQSSTNSDTPDTYGVYTSSTLTIFEIA